MKILFLTFALAVTVASAARGQTTAPEPAKPPTQELELRALDLSWHEAAAGHDAEALGRLLADDYQFDLDARRMLSKAQEVAAVGASDPLFDFGAFKLGDVSVRVEGERATVSGILNTRPAGADKKARPRYFYTRALIRRDDRWQIVSARLVSLAEGAR